jgi:hypothetical protein
LLIEDPDNDEEGAAAVLNVKMEPGAMEVKKDEPRSTMQSLKKIVKLHYEVEGLMCLHDEEFFNKGHYKELIK